MKAKKFYVYALCYPDGCPFYVGKGKDKRVFTHERAAKNRVLDRKSFIIQSIWDSGQEVLRKILFETNIESEAYRQEKLYIKSYSTIFELCNKTSGGGGIICKDPDFVQVRFSLPFDVYQTIKSHQRKLSAAQDTDATMEQALIDFIRKAKVK